MTGRRRSSLGLLVAALVVVSAGCGGGAGTEDGADEASPTPTADESPETIDIAGDRANFHGRADVAGQSEVEMEMDDFYFEPTVLQGEAGQEVTIHFHNEGQALHNFSLEQQGVDEDVRAGQEGEVSVAFPDSGTLQFTCKYHVGQGMVGGLSV